MRPFWMAGFVLCAVASGVSAQTPSSYEQGHSDRLAWEIWFGQLQGGRREGAEYWASQRSLAHPKNCGEPNGKLPQAFIDGCHEAQDRLNPTDIRRRTDPQYRLGWNAPLVTTGTAPATPANSAPAGPPTSQTTELPVAASAPPIAPVDVAPIPEAAQPSQDERTSPLWLIIASLGFMLFCMALMYIRNNHLAQVQGVRIVQRNSSSGVLSGIIGCTFGVLGILTLGFIFVPLAAIFSLIGVIRGAGGLSAFGVLVSLVGAGLTVTGFIMSPSLWVVSLGLIGAALH